MDTNRSTTGRRSSRWVLAALLATGLTPAIASAHSGFFSHAPRPESTEAVKADESHQVRVVTARQTVVLNFDRPAEIESEPAPIAVADAE